MNLLAFVLMRLREPSTYAGLGALLTAAGVHLSDQVLDALISAAVAVAGLAAVLLPEAGNEPAPGPERGPPQN